MRICVCEITKRWKAESTLLMSFLVELDRRGIVESTMSAEHGHLERFWGAKR